MQDHAILRRGLDILDGMGKKLEDGDRIEIADVTAVLQFLRVFGDEYHQDMEGKVLFPALLRAVPEPDPLRLLISEHADERLLVAEIEGALKSKRGMIFFQGSRRLIALLRNHFDKEDAIFPDLFGRWLSNAQDFEIAEQFTKFRKQLEIQLNFSRLESKYMPKPYSSPGIRSQELSRARASAASR